MARIPALARRFFERFEPVHAITYFSPESRDALAALGCKGLWSGYFAGRSAPLGRADPRVVEAIFYNFASSRVAKALSDAWAATSPEQALAAREAGAVAALHRYGLFADENLCTATELLGKAARGAPLSGRPLYAALLSVPWPDDPVAALWHAATLLREQRGDTHVAVLVASGISGRESNVLHVAAGRVHKDTIMRTRDYDDAEWNTLTHDLAARGLLEPDGSLTAAGQALKDDIEYRTDAASLAALGGLSDDEIEILFATLTPIARRVVACGDLPVTTPMGLRLDDLDDEGAHLR